VPTTSCSWPLHLERHILFIPSIWSFTKNSRSEKTIEWHSKILSSRIQTNHMCQPHHAHDPFHLEKAYFAYFFINLNKFFLHCMCHLKLYKTFWSAKTIEWHLKILSSKMKNGHMCQPTTCHDPLHLEKTYLVHSFINLNDFCCIKYARWRAIKWFWAPTKKKQCANICKSLSLRYQHVYPSSCN